MKPSRRAVLLSAAGAAAIRAQPAGAHGPLASSAAVPEWIRRAAIPLSTPVAGHGFDDMEPLKALVGDARIVALGEATHGTREFSQLKHRMLEFLVTRMGFSILSIEANMPESYRLNSYVLKGEGDPVQLLKGPLTLWDTQEVLDMVQWMRQSNRMGRARVEFTGFDMQNPPLALEIVRDFVAKSDAGFLPALARASKMALALNPRAVDPAIPAEWEKVVAHLESLPPREGIEWAIQNARIVLQFLQWGANLMKPQLSMPLRDASMAANVKWILDQSKQARIVLWAHNFHVMTGPLFPNQPGPDDSMGAVLRKMYGDQLLTFGFSFNQGSFRARSMSGAMQDFTVGPLPADSLDATLAASGLPLFALDLRKRPKTGPVAEWLGVSHSTRNIMAGFSEDRPNLTIFEQVVTNRYDCLLFVDQTTAARPGPKLA
ncbi:MAG: erythromycin esterase family protein [Acidobacteria bacterium]|nr:erythromycin esterase family protein [Acidobacteriota bacterium]